MAQMKIQARDIRPGDKIKEINSHKWHMVVKVTQYLNALGKAEVKAEAFRAEFKSAPDGWIMVQRKTKR